MQTPILDKVNSVGNETPPSAETPPAETGGTSLKGDLGAEKFVPVLTPTIATDDDTATVTTTPPKPVNVIDKSKSVDKMHKVDPKADTLTTIADKDEEDFIIGVETAHHEHK